MRSFGAPAPPLAPEPNLAEDAKGNNPISAEGIRQASTESTEWPGKGSSSANESSSDSKLLGKSKPGGSQSEAAGGSENQPIDVTAGTKQLAKELDEFVAKGATGAACYEMDDREVPPPDDEMIAELQLQTARKLRQLLPKNRELLYLIQERNWIPLLLGWLNLQDRPAVQMEALLALTNIAELCAHNSYYQHAQAQSSAAVAAAAAQAAAATAMKSGTSPAPSSKPSLYSFPTTPNAGDSGSASSSLSSSYPYNPLLPPVQGQVSFPPLSFSQKMTPEALAALDATLTNTIQQTKAATVSPSQSTDASERKPSQTKGLSSSAPMAPLPPLTSLTSSFPSTNPGSSQPLSSLLSSAASMSASSSGSPFLPPPTPVASFSGGAGYPQQLSASSQHLLLRHKDAIPTLVSLLSSPSREVYEQAMWILGSIAAGDSSGSSSHGGTSSSGGSGDGGREKTVAARDVLLAAGILNQLLLCLESHPQNLSLQRIGSWTLSNIVDGLFQQSSHGKSGSRSNDNWSSDEVDAGTLIHVLRRLLLMGDAEVLSYTCWTLSHLCDGPSSHISAVVTTKGDKAEKGGLVPRLVELLVHPSWRVTKPALRTIGNIVCAECSDDSNNSSSSGGPTDYTEVILECGAVPRLKELVTHNNREIQKEACWTLSNIAAGTVNQIQAVIDSGAISPLVKLVSDKNTDQEVRSEACWVVLNATSCGNDSQIEVLVDEGCVSVLGVLLGEPTMVMMALEGLERVLQVEETREAALREQVENAEDGAKDDEDDGKIKAWLQPEKPTKDKEGGGSKSHHRPSVVSASLIEKALEKHQSSAVTKRASRIWKQHFVYCALCNKSFSKHRTCDASFCEECKCYVCSNCDCRKYHLSYQEELWAEEEVEVKKSAKKSKKQKKKEKQRQKKAKQQAQPQPPSPTPALSKDVKEAVTIKEKTLEDGGSGSVSTGSTESEGKKGESIIRRDKVSQAKPNNANNHTDGVASKEGTTLDENVNSQQKPPVDFVSYLEETGSMIALATLMDALYSSDGSDHNMDDDFDETNTDAQLLGSRHEHVQQATT